MKINRCLFLLVCVLAVIHTNAQHYKTVHKNAIVVDTHNDVLSAATMTGLNIEKNLKGKAHSDIRRLFEGGIDVQVFSVFCDEKFGKDTAFKLANVQIDSLHAIINRNNSRLTLVTSPQELEAAVSAEKLGCMIGVEGGHMIEDNLENLETLYKKGARYLTLTWNNSTSWASSAKDESNKEAQKIGLSAFGTEVVKKMNDLGMMIDLSHVGEKTFWDVMKLTNKPVLLSHSSVYAICPVFRNLKDDQIKAVAKNGGVIQINFYPGFLDAGFSKKRQQLIKQRKQERDSLKNLNWPDADISAWISKKYAPEFNKLRPPLSVVFDHIDYIVKLVGADYVGIGADMDGVDALPKDFNGVEDYPKITRGLLQRGYSEEDVNKILGGNFIRVFKANAATGGV